MSWQVIGHDWEVELLSRGLEAGRVAHAFLFTGPPQIGKTTMALALAQALNCDHPSPPCNRCTSCLKIAQGTHPDVQVLVGQGAAAGIKIEQIRALQRETVLTPYEGRFRVAILGQIDRATTEAANSLLKTLEEPPAHLVLVLTAAHVEVLPETVVSRCQRLDLGPVARSAITAALMERGIKQVQAHLLAQLSGGRVGWAIDASRNETMLQQRQRDLEQILDLMAGDRVDRLDFAWKASRNPDTARKQIELWSTLWRDLLLLQGTGETHIMNVDWMSTLHSLARQVSPAQAWTALSALQETVDYLDANVNGRLALERLMLKLPRLHSSERSAGSQRSG